jgi:hypothetical protein
MSSSLVRTSVQVSLLVPASTLGDRAMDEAGRANLAESIDRRRSQSVLLIDDNVMCDSKSFISGRDSSPYVWGSSKLTHVS